MWDGQKKERFREALCWVYPNSLELEMFLVDKDICRSIEEITAETTLRGKTFQLIQWAERQGSLENLFEAFCDKNAGNPVVQTLKEELTAEPSNTPASENNNENTENYRKSILMVAANPRGTRPLRLQEEERKIKERLRLAGYGQIPINSVVATRPIDIQQALLDFQPQIVHFSGHGASEEGLVFENANGEVQFISSQALGNLFKLFSEQVECVVLNACYSQHQAAIIAQHIDCVIGMKEAIGDRAAIEFSVGFYTAIGSGASIEFAYNLACNTIQLEGISEESTPGLFKKEEYNQPVQESEPGERPTTRDSSESQNSNSRQFQSTATETALRSFEFETATVEIKAAFFGKNIQIHRRRQQAQGFSEPLGNNIELEMVYISSGTFLMGAPESEEESQDDERPQHQVSVPAFFLGKYPVTQAQWRAVANLPKCERDLKPNPSGFSGDNRPVEKVSWWDAVEFCQRLSQHTGRDYRLPSEAEWEYACRAGTQTPFYFGETITTDLANYDGNEVYGRGKKGEHRKQTTDVGSFPANGFGLFDMHGNVWEWCADDWHNNYKGAPTNGSAWIDLKNRTKTPKLLRGGSWLNVPHGCRSAIRDWRRPASLSDGFRVACASARTL